LIVVFILIVNQVDTLTFGLQFLETEPSHFDCLLPEHHTDSDGADVLEEVWKECTKNDVCENGLDHEHFHPHTEDDDFVDNFVESLDMLCESKYKVGLIGSLYLIGVICSLIFVPLIGDKCGRKIPFSLTILVSLFS